MNRPKHLANFTSPPLKEVVLGVQFGAIPSYSSLFAQEVWSLFQPGHPNFSEQPVLPPSFESFGGGNPQPSFQFQIGSAPVGSRYWFDAEKSSDLIQFQSDRFIANWRQGASAQDYPRFEGVSEAYAANLRSLNKYVTDRFDSPLSINQSEVAYINIIPVEEFSDASGWFRLWDGGDISLENLNISFDEVINDETGNPYARLKHQIQSVFSSEGNLKAFTLSLTFIGKPKGSDVDSAVAFMGEGRERIVKRFEKITTESAQKSWGKIS